MRKMRVDVSTGDECPDGNGVFQRTLDSGPNSTGRLVVADTPEPFGPRNCGQFVSSVAAAGKRPSRARQINKARNLCVFNLSVPNV